MSTLGKPPALNWRIGAALVCMALATSPGSAAPRHAPHPSTAPAPGAAGGAPPAGQAKPEGDASGSHDTASKGPPEHGGKGLDGKGMDGKATGGKPVGQIDLTRPDDGYGVPRRHVARPLFIAPHTKLPVGSTAIIGPHPPTMPDHLRNAAGAAVPAGPVLPAVAGSARREPVHLESTGGVRNNLGLGASGMHPAPVHFATTPAPPKPPVIGINGTTLHPSAPGIGGPAKDHSAIGGSSFKHK